MLIFIIPLRSKAVSHDWQRVSDLCVRTVISCCQQSDSGSHTILVCHEKPFLPAGLKNLSVIEVDFPIPIDKHAQMLDKYRKIQRGLIHARAMVPLYWMKVDSDDCVSNRLAGFVASNPKAEGWLFNKGWVHQENSSTVYLYRKNFFKLCGTSSIIYNRNTTDLPVSMGESLQKFSYLNISHSELDKFAIMEGKKFNRLPFPGAIYCAGTGENHSGFLGVHSYKSRAWWLRRLLNTRLISSRLRHEFGLTTLPLMKNL
jgi:hypothetical protein